MPGTTRHIGKPSFMEERIIPKQEVEIKTTSFRGRGGSKVAESAKRLVGAKSLRVDGVSYRYDCSGFVIAAYAWADISIDGSAKMLYEYSKEENVFHHRKKPFVGDAVFFDNSYDRNKNGRRDDKLTHIAIVEKVESDGTLTLIHLGSKGIVRTIMNLYYPDMHKDQNGKTLNSYLRASKSSPNLTGELWAGFGSLWKID